METTPESPVIAIDGGGTHCRIAGATARGVVTVETGSANISTDFDGAVSEVLRGLQDLSSRLGRRVADLADMPAYVGLAGVTGPAISDRLRAALPFGTVRVADDRPAALRGALGRKDGLIAHCGTGSFYGAQVAGAQRFAGGWGPVLGDEASAKWIGRKALSLTLECADGRRAASPLSERFLEQFGGTAGIVAFAGTARPTEFGALAPTVTRFGEDGDTTARSVMQAGADEIARALRLFGWAPATAICLTGGVGPSYAGYLPAEMQRDLAPPAGTPLDGALALARDLCAEDAA